MLRPSMAGMDTSLGAPGQPHQLGGVAAVDHGFDAALDVHDPRRRAHAEHVRALGRRGIERVYALFPRLQERRTQLAGTLSGGERQMLALGRALMSTPRLLMLDEPSLGLAPLIVREIFATIERLRAQGTSILLIEQNARAALAVSDHGYVLETGAFALQGPAEQLAGDPRVIETYLGAQKQG